MIRRDSPKIENHDYRAFVNHVPAGNENSPEENSIETHARETASVPVFLISRMIYLAGDLVLPATHRIFPEITARC